MDGYRWNLRVRSTGSGEAMAYVRTHQFGIGAPVHFDEEYHRVTALEYVLAALGADVVTGFRTLARRRRLSIDHVESVVSGELNNALSYLGVIGEDGHPGLERITIRVYVGSDESEEQLRQVWQEVLARSPLVHTFAPAVTLDLRLTTAL